MNIMYPEYVVVAATPSPLSQDFIQACESKIASVAGCSFKFISQQQHSPCRRCKMFDWVMGPTQLEP